MNKNDFEDLIQMGLEFELAWLNYKKETYTSRSKQEHNRMKTINHRLQR